MFPSNIDKYRSHMKINAVFSTIGWVAFCGLFDATLVSTSIAAPDDQAAVKEVVRQHEKAALEAFKTHDKEAYAKLCCEEFYEITSDGTINTLQAELKELDDYVLGEYKMDDIVVTILSDTVALIRYKILAKWTYKGKNCRRRICLLPPCGLNVAAIGRRLRIRK